MFIILSFYEGSAAHKKRRKKGGGGVVLDYCILEAFGTNVSMVLAIDVWITEMMAKKIWHHYDNLMSKL